MSHNFLKAMAKLQSFLGRSPCRVCDSRACVRPGFCDDHAQIDRAIKVCAQVSTYASLEDCQKSASFKGMDEGQIYLAYRAGELLGGKR